MNRDKNTARLSIAKHFEEGASYPVIAATEVAGEQMMVKCSEGAFKAMWHHARRGLPRDEGGTLSSDPVEVKGFLLGTVEISGEVRIIHIKDVIQLPLSEQDAGDAAYFNAKDRAILEQRLRNKSSLQMVGNYHSHPNHDIKLSDQDVVYLSQYLPEKYHVAAIVGPREPAVGFFLKDADGNYSPWQDPHIKVDYTEEGAPVIELEQSEDGQTTINIGKRVNLKKYGIIAFIAALVLAFTVYKIMDSRIQDQPILILDEGRVSLSSAFPTRILALSVDRECEFKFEVEIDEEDQEWLQINAGSHELSFSDPEELIIEADISKIPHLEKMDAHVKIRGYSTDETEYQADVDLLVIAENDKVVIEREISWTLNPIRIQHNNFIVNLENLPAEFSGERVQVYGFRKRDNKWEEVWNRSTESEEIGLPADAFKSPLTWSEIRVTARASRRDQLDDNILQYRCEGSTTYKKRLREWDLEGLRFLGENIVLEAEPLPYPGFIEVEVERGGRWRSVGSIMQPANEEYISQIAWDDDLGRIRIKGAYVGESDVLEYRYTEVIDQKTVSSDMAFDGSQGEQGRLFRLQNPDKYTAGNLAYLGKIGGPRYLKGIADLQQRWRLQLVTCNRVHPGSWAHIAHLDRGLQEVELGRLAWDFKGEHIVLYLITPGDGERSGELPDGYAKFIEGWQWLARDDWALGQLKGIPDNMRYGYQYIEGEKTGEELEIPLSDQ